MAPNARSNPLPNRDGNDAEDLQQFLDDEDNKSTMTEEESLVDDLGNYYHDGAFGDGWELHNLFTNEMVFPHSDQVKKQLSVQVPQYGWLAEDPAFDVVMDIYQPNEQDATSMDFFFEFNDLFDDLDEFDEDFFGGAGDMEF